MTFDTAPEVEESVENSEKSYDLASGVIVVLFGSAILFTVRDYPTLPSGELGPSLFPGIIGGLMVLMGVLLLGRWLKARKAARVHSPAGVDSGAAASAPATTPAPHRVYWRGWINAGLVIGSIIFYLLAVEFLGFLTTMIVIMVGLMLRLGAKWWVAIVAGVLATVGVWLIFNKVLLVPLPLGFWG
ncbi:tripartite tricarboxylate transporter TctB family protein [Salinibacterium sp. SWN1162]|uniref:tripartite tricarboxylate transporter TctB family protein n=1 Tax=Salinibacterium sp. SWN1162 TaxID=2792053 RepID=UPI0018CE9C05|nr:tripartite tricarboxylate transporter TctB family protein [Salinibacterium sp. SWN1162]MBH0008830.1 tripartite tricarboxylate transporter TctB family protein [Salinibacterium sp. SWN1162]